jgi:hypothetical protein
MVLFGDIIHGILSMFALRRRDVNVVRCDSSGFAGPKRMFLQCPMYRETLVGP